MAPFGVIDSSSSDHFGRKQIPHYTIFNSKGRYALPDARACNIVFAL